MKETKEKPCNANSATARPRTRLTNAMMSHPYVYQRAFSAQEPHRHRGLSSFPPRPPPPRLALPFSR